MLNRRQFLNSITKTTLGFAGALALPAKPRAASLTKITVALGWVPNVEYAGMWIAMNKGYFAQEGLEVDFIPGGPNAAGPVVSVASAKAQVGVAALLPLLDAVQKGNDFVLFGYAFPKSPLGLLSLASDPILKVDDIVGAKILSQDLNARTAINAVLKLNGLPETWQEVPAGFSPEPLLAKQGKGYVAYETNQVVTLEKMGLVRGKDFHFLNFYDAGFKVFSGGMFTSRSVLSANRPQFVGLCRALSKGWKENEADPKLAARLVVDTYARDFGLSYEQQTASNAVQVQLMQASGGFGINADQIAGPIYKSAEATGRTNLPPIDKLIDASIIREATG